MTSTLRVGHYKLKAGHVWLPALIRVECPTDDQGRMADRPRLTLYIGAERHERPTHADWAHRLWPCSEREYFRLRHAHDARTVAKGFDLKTAPPLW